MAPTLAPAVAERLRVGTVIPAHPLALDADGRLSERHQRALSRYYLAAGAGGLAVGVHTTQFEIRGAGLLEPVLELAAEERRAADPSGTIALVAGVCGPVSQAVAEAETARTLGYDLALLSPGGLGDLSEAALLDRARHVAEVLPVFGFYLQPAVGGRILSRDFWRAFAEIPGVAAIKIAPFDRYATLEVVRAVCEAARGEEVALYTGNDDNIVADLLTPFEVDVGGRRVRRWIVGGLLGQWAVWTRAAVDLLGRIRRQRERPEADEGAALLGLGARLTEANATIFDAAHGFAGCIPGIHEVLARQGLLATTRCLDPHERLSVGQADEIARVAAAYPELTDDAFVHDGLDGWLGG